jgi:hypothetical protein
MKIKTEKSSEDKWELRREDNCCTQIWKYDKNKNKNGPVSVETIWKSWILDEWENKRLHDKDTEE